MEQEGTEWNTTGLADMEQDWSGRERTERDDIGRKETGQDGTEFLSSRRTGRKIITRGGI